MINAGILEEVPSSCNLLVDQLGLLRSFEDFDAAAALNVSCGIIHFYLLCQVVLSQCSFGQFIFDSFPPYFSMVVPGLSTV